MYFHFHVNPYSPARWYSLVYGFVSFLSYLYSLATLRTFLWETMRMRRLA